MREKIFPNMICAATEAGDEDVRIDEAGHLHPGIEGFHGGGKDALRSTKGIIIDGTKGRHPFGGVGRGQNLARTGGEVAELLGGPVRQRLAAVRREGVKPQLQPVIEIQDESAHGWQNTGSDWVFKEQTPVHGGALLEKFVSFPDIQTRNLKPHFP